MLLTPYRLIVVTTLLLSGAISSPAQQIGALVGAGPNYSRVTSRDKPGEFSRYKELGLFGGGSFKFKRFVALASAESNIFWTKTTTPPSVIFQKDALSNGQIVCRDITTGEFADKEMCENQTKRNRKTFGARLFDGNVLIPEHGRTWMLGAGYRDSFGEKTRGLYGAVGLTKASRGGLFFTRILGGQTVAQLQAGYVFYWPR